MRAGLLIGALLLFVVIAASLLMYILLPDDKVDEESVSGPEATAELTETTTPRSPTAVQYESTQPLSELPDTSGVHIPDVG